GARTQDGAAVPLRCPARPAPCHHPAFFTLAGPSQAWDPHPRCASGTEKRPGGAVQEPPEDTAWFKPCHRAITPNEPGHSSLHLQRRVRLGRSPRRIPIKIVLTPWATMASAGDDHGISFRPSGALIVPQHLPPEPRLQFIHERPSDKSDDQ